jgi:peptide/histidine transporter 3/4
MALTVCKINVNDAFVFKISHLSPIVMLAIMLFFSFLLVILLTLGCIKRHWFYFETKRQNPYRMVIKVLNFAWIHKYPLQRSAFTYCDDERPSRFDYAKESYGGPFTTEQVEDVKTFLKIMIILLAVGPVSILDVVTSDTIFLFIGLHIGSEDPLCNLSSIIVNSGLLRYIVSTIFFPVYMWIIFSLLRDRTPRILWRLGFGIFLYILGVFCILVVETVGHLQFDGHQTECIFDITLNVTESYAIEFDVPHLGINWTGYVLCNLFVGIGSPLVTVTIFEFISAQGPHSMKGLLLGIYYFITGFYQFMSSVAIVLFGVLRGVLPISSYVGCLFGYLLLICVIGTLGLVLFLVACRWYRCRVREDRPYDQRFVVDVYERYLDQGNAYSYSYGSESD